MSCPHTETTAILAAFGEAPDDFEGHLAACDECRQVVAEHLQTLSIIEPAVGPSNRQTQQRTSPYAIGFLLAAAALLAVQFVPPNTAIEIQTTAHNPTTTTVDDIFDEPIDDELASLEVELALFNLEDS